MKFVDWLHNLFRLDDRQAPAVRATHGSSVQQLSPAPQAKASPLPPDFLITMVRLAEKTEEVEYACDEVFAVLDQYAEAVRRGEDVSALMPMVRHHMEICPGCCEELEALLAVLNAGGE